MTDPINFDIPPEQEPPNFSDLVDEFVREVHRVFWKDRPSYVIFLGDKDDLPPCWLKDEEVEKDDLSGTPDSQ